MSTTATVVVIVAAGWIGFSAFSLSTRKKRSWSGPARRPGQPDDRDAAAVGLIAYFAGAVITIVRARSFGHIPFPLLYLVPAAAAGWLLAAS